jgi:hypothetical protein
MINAISLNGSSHNPIKLLGFLFFLFYPVVSGLKAQGEGRYQYPTGLRNAYFGFSIGSIHYNFTPESLEKPMAVGSIEIPHTAVRFTLYGYRFGENFSAQVSYMRPVTFARYRNVDGEDRFHNVWMSVGSLTLNGDVPVSKKLSVAGEGGLAVVTRKGFMVNGEVAMKSASYASLLFGASLRYRVDKRWHLKIGSMLTPAHGEVKQPATSYHSAGFEYNLQPLSNERIARNRAPGHHFPHQFAYIGYSSNAAGYGVNNFLSEGTIPVFWGGEAHVRRGVTLQYQRNIFHARKVFALDWAATIGAWQSNDLRQDFYTASLSPVLKFNVIRSKALDLGIEYSVAGPTFISRPVIDKKLTGGRFTFYDFMGLYGFAGKKKNVYAGLRIAHFSNGNMLYNNEGVKVPLTVNAGVAW